MLFFCSTTTLFSTVEEDCLRTRTLNRIYDTYNYVATHTPPIRERLKQTYDNILNSESGRQAIKFVKELSDPSPESESSNKVLRNILYQIGERPFGQEGKSVNEHARDFIINNCPQLIGTDYFSDPLTTLSYFIFLDPEGFVNEVRIIRGPLNTSLTLMEAMEYYQNIDPQQAKRYRRMINNLLRLRHQNMEEEEILEILIESLHETKELMQDYPEDS